MQFSNYIYSTGLTIKKEKYQGHDLWVWLLLFHTKIFTHKMQQDYSNQSGRISAQKVSRSTFQGCPGNLFLAKQCKIDKKTTSHRYKFMGVYHHVLEPNRSFVMKFFKFKHFSSRKQENIAFGTSFRIFPCCIAQNEIIPSPLIQQA